MGIRFIRNTISLLFFILILALFYAQILRGDFYLNKAKNNYIKIISLPSVRGSIFDRNNVLLAEDRPIFNVAIIPYEIKSDKDSFFKTLASFLGIKEEMLEDNYKRGFRNIFSPVDILVDIDKEVALKVKDKFKDSVIVRGLPQRHYMYPYSFAHLLGYVKDASIIHDELKEYGYSPFERIGFGGIEQYYNSYLKGEDGADLIEVDSGGKMVGFLGKKEKMKGKNLSLTIDANFQRVAYRSLAEVQGAIIIMDPYSGEIIALVSSPSFNTNYFLQGRGVHQTLSNPDNPLLNRAIQSRYSPGSVFKPILALGGLQEDIISEYSTYNCKGKVIYGDTEFGCWSVHGDQNVVEALTHSCNVFFYKLGVRMKVERISAWARHFQLDRYSGVDLPYERRGLVPDRSWKKKHTKVKWFGGDTLNLSIGQGYLEITPLRAAIVISAFANGGYLVHPYLAQHVDATTLPHLGKIPLSVKDNNLEIVTRGLRGAVSSPSGTAHLLDELNLDIAGKTGTTQTSGQSHAWFVGYFPYDAPRYSFCIFLEHGGSSYQALKVAYHMLTQLQEEHLL